MDIPSPPPRMLLFASGNRYKLAEMRQGFACIPGLTLMGADGMASVPVVCEDADTFEGNARKKARVFSAISGLWALADDSGLEVEALGGEPGVRSARFGGRQGDDVANNRLLLHRLDGIVNRAARFCCVLALCAPDGRCWNVAGICEGTLLATPRGEQGFGYDPLFVPRGETRTFAEMSAMEKAAYSHRGAAIRRALAAWRPLWDGIRALNRMMLEKSNGLS